MNAALKRLLRKHPEGSAVLLVLVLIVVFVVTTEGSWGNVANLQSVFQISAVLALMAMGVALVIITGEIDISVGSTFGISALCFLGLVNTLGAAIALLASLAAAAAIGLLNGFVVTRFRVPSLIATLGTLFMFRGIAYALTEGFSFTASAEAREAFIYQAFGGSTIGGFNIAILWTLVVLVALQIMLFFTPFGNRLLATGGSADSALSRGVRTDRVKRIAFLLSALLAGFAGVLEANKIGFADGSFGRLMELEAISAAVIGGCALAGGRGSVIGALLGAFALSGIQSFLIIQGVQPQWYILLLGVLIVLAILAERRLHAWATG